MEKLAGGVSHAENVTLPNRYLAKKTNKNIDGEGSKVLQRGRPWRNHPSDEVVANMLFLTYVISHEKKRRLLELVLKKLVGLCSTIFFHFLFSKPISKNPGDSSMKAEGLQRWSARSLGSQQVHKTWNLSLQWKWSTNSYKMQLGIHRSESSWLATPKR